MAKKEYTKEEKKHIAQIVVIIAVTLLILAVIAVGGHIIEIKYFR